MAKLLDPRLRRRTVCVRICVMWLCVVTHSYVLAHCEDWTRKTVWILVFVKWFIYMCCMNDSYMCDMTYLHLCCDSLVYVWCDSFTCGVWLVRTCLLIARTLIKRPYKYAHVSFDSFMCVIWLSCVSMHTWESLSKPNVGMRGDWLACCLVCCLMYMWKCTRIYTDICIWIYTYVCVYIYIYTYYMHSYI